MEEHKNILRSKHPEQSEDWITREQTETFPGWLQTHLMHDDAVEDDLYLLSQSPSSNIMTFKGYEINGNMFYMITQDKKSTNQNSGVRYDATNFQDTYYGYIEEIWELDYGPLKVPLFRCKWVNMTGGGVQVDP
jgi:hypothetical protein